MSDFQQCSFYSFSILGTKKQSSLKLSQNVPNRPRLHTDSIRHEENQGLCQETPWYCHSAMKENIFLFVFQQTVC